MSTAPTIELELPPDSYVRFTGRQKMALMLHRGGYTHEQIAEKMEIRHRQNVTRLIARARQCERDLRRAAQEFLENN